MKAYKGTDIQLQCNGFQYEVGKDYSHCGDIELCKSGFHGCKNPLDVLKYYNLIDSKFLEIEQSGKTKTSGDKTVSSKIKIKTELGLKGFIEAGVQFLLEKTSKQASSGNGAQQASSGYGAQQASSGNHAKQASSGYGAKQASSGYGAQQASSGYGAQQASSGYGAKQASSGNDAKQASSGNYAQQASSGDDAQHELMGKNSIAAAIGIRSKIKAANGNWMVLVDWRYENKVWQIKQIYHTKVGGKIKGVKIKPDTFYWFEGGKLNTEGKDANNDCTK